MLTLLIALPSSSEGGSMVERSIVEYVAEERQGPTKQAQPQWRESAPIAALKQGVVVASEA